MRALPRLTVVLSAGALLVAGCGGDDAPAPSSLAPSSSTMYAEVQLRPGADVTENLEAAAAKLLGTDDGRAALSRLLGPGLSRAGLDFSRDVEPWLGDTAAVAVTGGRDGAALVATTDEDAALAAVRRRGGRVRETSYRGVDVGVAGGRASAVVDGTLVAGSARAVRAVIDVAEGERKALGSLPRFTRAREDAEAEGAPGFAYVDVARSLSAAAASAEHIKKGLLLSALGSAGLETLGVAFEGDGDALRVRGALRTAKALPTSGGDGAADAVAGAPADALVAVGVGDVGGALTRTLDGLDGLLGVGAEAVLGQLRKETGLDARKDLLAWMGDATLVVRGRSLRDAKGTLVVRSRDAAASAAALPQVVSALRARGVRLEPAQVAGADRAWALRGAQYPVVVAVGGSRVVVGVGRGAVRDALAGGGDTLATSPRFRSASALLGDGVRPSAWVDPAGLASLLGGAPPAAAQVLKAIDAVVAGGQPDGQLQRFEGVVALG